ncbi:hypothetical protein MCOR27_010975 [Pyricularia oryzae]|uniref:Uncharacterized protein n=2 Tax=Pyricularia TaxID=48558 RepID=A0ABQ8N1Z7_PYRGI|nr:hypothetical protein MCOR01_009538 [Pyricularia oryzae]KAI6289870.1 hypothetical protein MCOR33_011670 [Pyricularia grisea]KAH9437194.1 hypothetical protein MCOR02_000850 [Pyricularia oryzae]KAI6258830.1 hypothetical protein MCOR19_004760 [Pyricularia oryzae]KAI6266573.1 hypothetical protein MCOR27_010975 [Pyricularia oryzae]
MIAVQDYSVDSFNSIGELHTAKEKFDTVGGDKLVEQAFLELFRRHGVDRIFGLTMVHRHFELNGKERLVDFQGTAVPWEEVDELNNPGITAASWEITPQGIRPYEFKLDPASIGAQEVDFNDPKIQAFAKEFVELTQRAGATGLFGLCVYPGDDFESLIETTQGRANISIPFKPFNNMKDGFVDATWFFSPKIWEARGRCVCVYNLWGNHTGHRWRG